MTIFLVSVLQGIFGCFKFWFSPLWTCGNICLPGRKAAFQRNRFLRIQTGYIGSWLKLKLIYHHRLTTFWCGYNTNIVTVQSAHTLICFSMLKQKVLLTFSIVELHYLFDSLCGNSGWGELQQGTKHINTNTTICNGSVFYLKTFQKELQCHCVCIFHTIYTYLLNNLFVYLFFKKGFITKIGFLKLWPDQSIGLPTLWANLGL